MKVTVNFGRTRVVVPCKDGWMVRDLIVQATQRYRKIVQQDGEFLVRTHHVEYADGGILDPDDMLTDLVEDKDKLVAVYEEMELQQRGAGSPGGSAASGYSSPEPSESEPGGFGSEIEVTSSALKSSTPLLVRSSSELILAPPLDAGTRDADTYSSRPPTTGGGHALTVKSVSMDRLKEDAPVSRTGLSSLTRTVEISGDLGPLGIKVVPYCSSLSGRTLGLHVKGIEENSRSRREGIFEEDECIVQINDTKLMDKSFNQSQEVFRQAMSSPVVRLEVLPVSNKVQYEKSLISQLFSNPDSAHLPSLSPAPKLKSPFLLRKVEAPPPAPASVPAQAPPLAQREEPPAHRTPAELEQRAETPPPSSPAPPPPQIRSESPALKKYPAPSGLASAGMKKGGKRQKIILTKGSEGLGFTVVTRDSTVHGPGPILVKSILPCGAAVKDGRLQSGDRILEVNGVDVTGHTQEELVAMLRSTKLGETVSLLVSRQDELFLPRELKGEAPAPVLSEDGREQLMYEVPLNDSGSAGLGVSLKGNKSRETGEDLGIFIKSIMHGGAAFKDGRLRVDDQLVAVNGEPLLGRSNHDAMETLRRSMSTEGNLRGTIQLVVLRVPDQRPNSSSQETQAGESPPVPRQDVSRSNGFAQPSMVTNSIYERTPVPFRPEGREEGHGEEELHPVPPRASELPEFGRAQSREPVSSMAWQTPPQQQQQQQQQRRLPEHLTSKPSKTMDLAPGLALGPVLGLHKSSSLESLQAAMEEARRGEAPFHRPGLPTARGRGCNMSFRQAIDKSYDGPSEPEDDDSDDSSGRDAPAGSSSHQEVDEKKKKKTKKKKGKKTKAKKKDEAEDPDKKTKKKGFGLLRFGRKNKDDKAREKLGALSEEELSKSEAELYPHASEADGSVPARSFTPDVEDDDDDPEYARIGNFREPPPAGRSPRPVRVVPGEDVPEGLYAKVDKRKPPAADSNDARLQRIRNQLQHVRPAPSYSELGAGHRVQEYDPSRIRGPDFRAGPRHEDAEPRRDAVSRRTPTETPGGGGGPPPPRYPDPAIGAV